MINGNVGRNGLFYGWVVVGIGVVLMATNGTIMYSFGVFFKPLLADFGWSRAETSIVQSISLVCNGLFSIFTGWLADRFGRARVLATCGILLGSGLLLTSQVSSLWQISLTYGVMVGIGLSSTYVITATTTARWFRERRGLALGITASGNGVGSLLGVPAVAHLIEAFGWSSVYLILGAAAFVIMLIGAQFLKRNPETTLYSYDSFHAPPTQRGSGHVAEAGDGNPRTGNSLLTAIRVKSLWLLCGLFFLFSFCNQMIMVHLVNYATDTGIAPLVAATLIGIVGLSGFAGRILMGGASDRIGNINALIVACLSTSLGLVLLIFAKELWMFYLLTIFCGFAHGAENPQATALIGRLFGFQAMLVGIVHFSGSTGGAIGAWVGGRVFDLTGSYHVAFLIALVAIVSALVGTVLLGRLPKLRRGVA